MFYRIMIIVVTIVTLKEKTQFKLNMCDEF